MYTLAKIIHGAALLLCLLQFSPSSFISASDNCKELAMYTYVYDLKGLPLCAVGNGTLTSEQVSTREDCLMLCAENQAFTSLCSIYTYKEDLKVCHLFENNHYNYERVTSCISYRLDDYSTYSPPSTKGSCKIELMSWGYQDIKPRLHQGWIKLNDITVLNISDIDNPTLCRQTARGVEYFGTISTTNTGRTCQALASQSPHSHIRLAKNGFYYPEGNETLAANYCRNPDNWNAIWCYTTDPGKRWDYCDVPLCAQPWGTYSDINTAILSFETCQLEDVQRFKVSTSSAETTRFIEYIKSLPPQLILLGVTAGNPWTNLAPAYPTIEAMGGPLLNNGIFNKYGKLAWALQLGNNTNKFFQQSLGEWKGPLGLNINVWGNSLSEVEMEEF